MVKEGVYYLLVVGRGGILTGGGDHIGRKNTNEEARINWRGGVYKDAFRAFFCKKMI